jgi:hypothetical protein
MARIIRALGARPPRLLQPFVTMELRAIPWLGFKDLRLIESPFPSMMSRSCPATPLSPPTEMQDRWPRFPPETGPHPFLRHADTQLVPQSPCKFLHGPATIAAAEFGRYRGWGLAV